MSDDWQVKEVKKSGNGFWINIEPSYGNDSYAGAHLFNIVVLSFAFMSLFGVTGFKWWLFWAVISAVVSWILFLPSMIVSLILVAVFIFT